MDCPHCNSKMTFVMSQYTNPNDDVVKVYRCTRCGNNFTTVTTDAKTTTVRVNPLVAFCLAIFMMFAFTSNAQHFIGEPKGTIIGHFAYDQSVCKMAMKPETMYGRTLEVLSYYFGDRTQYYYINPDANVCESYAALFYRPTAKDSLIKVYDARYKRLPYTQDTVAVMWIEYGDGINYKRILRDFSPPACLVILAVDKKVED